MNIKNLKSMPVNRVKVDYAHGVQLSRALGVLQQKGNHFTLYEINGENGEAASVEFEVTAQQIKRAYRSEVPVNGQDLSPIIELKVPNGRYSLQFETKQYWERWIERLELAGVTVKKRGRPSELILYGGLITVVVLGLIIMVIYFTYP